MKRLTIKLVIPLTVLSFIIINKWWYVLVIDGTDEIMYGFPLIYTCKGFHTSLSSQYFIMELLIDLLTYLLFWFITIFLVNRFLFRIRLHKAIFICLLTATVIFIGFSIFIMSWQENLFFLKRDFQIEKMETGYNFIWQEQARLDYHENHPGNK